MSIHHKNHPTKNLMCGKGTMNQFSTNLLILKVRLYLAYWILGRSGLYLDSHKTVMIISYNCRNSSFSLRLEEDMMVVVVEKILYHLHQSCLRGKDKEK